LRERRPPTTTADPVYLLSPLPLREGERGRGVLRFV
jgi:hypothetical protein